MKILEVCVDLDGGGIDRYLYNYCSRIKDIRFDFAIVENNKIGILEAPIKALGCNIYRVPRQSAGPKQNYAALKKIMTENKYDAVHVHLGYKGALALLCAKNCGIKTRIVHAHIAYVPEGPAQRAVRRIMTFFTKCLATDLAACGNDAARWVWGKSAFEKGKVTVHNNAIETGEYAFSPSDRQFLRNSLGIADGTFVVGHVGRICEQKNQLRLAEIFAEISRKNSNSKLLMVGFGGDEYEKSVRHRAKELNIQNNIEFLGVRSDVKQLLNAFDVFVFPSAYEGLPFTLIETQCNGLYAISSDAVTKDVKVSDCVEFLSLEKSDSDWADTALRLGKNGHNALAYKDVAAAGYDIDTEAAKLREYYFNSIKTEVKNE